MERKKDIEPENSQQPLIQRKVFVYGTYGVRKMLMMLIFTSKYLLDAARMTLWALMNRPSAARVMSSIEWEASRAESLDTRSRG